MAIDAYGNSLATSTVSSSSTTATKDKTKLDNNDFMTLLLVEMQNQDPTEPMDSEKILTQTSQLATLESSDKTNKSLEDLSASLSASQQFSAIDAIGKTADLGSNAVQYTEGEEVTFEMYFPSAIEHGNIEVLDSNGNVVKNMEADSGDSGTYTYTWDGTDTSGNAVDEGIYYITSSYTTPDNENLTTRIGTYPIDSVRFEGTDAFVKVGSNYVALNKIKEIY